MGKESGGDSAEVLGEAFFKERKAELEQRVSKKRFTHVMGVVEEAERLRLRVGVRHGALHPGPGLRLDCAPRGRGGGVAP